MSDQFGIELEVDSSSAKTSVSEFEKFFAQSVARIKTLSNQIKLAEKASADVRAAAEIAATEKVAAVQQKQTNAFLTQLGRKITLMKESNRLAEKQADDEAKRVDYLQTKYNAAYAAKKLFDNISSELHQAMQLEGADVEKLTVRLSELNTQYNLIGSSTKNTAEAFIRQQQATNGFGVGVSRAGVLIQQAGYQFGDFLVQVQSGTNAFVAFGQQATQMVGFMSPVWEGLGLTALRAAGLTTALSIVIPLVTALGAAWMRTSKDTKEAADTIESHIKSLQSTVDQAHLDNIKIGFSVDESSVAQVREDMIKAQMSIAEDMLRVNQLNKIGGRATAFIGASQEEIDAQQEIINNGQKLLDQLAAEREARRMLAGQSSAAAAVQARIVFDKAEELRLAKEQADAQQKSADKANYLKNVFHALAGEAGSVSMYLGNWPKLLDQAAAAASRINLYKLGTLNSGMMGRAGAPGQNQKDYSLKGWQDTLPDTKTGGSSGGGSGTASALIDSLMTQQEQVDKWYEESQKSLQSASDKELEILGGKYEAMQRLDDEYRKRQFEAQQAQSQLLFQSQSGMYSALGDLLSQFGQKSKAAAVAALAIQKGLSIAQIIANTAAAQMRAFAEFGPVAGAAMAARIGLLGKLQMGLVAATGLAQAGNILSGGTAGAKGSVGTSSVATEAAPQQVMIQGLKPTDIFTGQQLSDLFDSLYKENRNRGMVFMVQR